VVELDPVNVTASRVTSPSLTVPDLDAARADLALTPGGTEVVDADRYLTGRASTLADTFFLSPGVVAQPRFGSDEARLSIRGSGLQRTFHGRGIRVLQDGVPINVADGGFDMQSLEPTAASHINVWRGGNALAYGASTLGGAIDYVSRNGRNSPGGFARLEIGSWEYLRATIAGGAASASSSADAYASFTQQQQDGFRDHAAQNNQRLFANAGFRHSDNIETRVYVSAVKTDSELPGNLTKAELEADPRQADTTAFGSVNYDNKRDYELLRVAGKTTVNFSDTSYADFVFAWTYKDLDHPITPFAGALDYLYNDLLLGATLTRDGELFARENRLRAGVFFTRGETNATVFENNLGTRGALRQRDEQTASNLEAFIENQTRLGAGLSGIVGLSATHSVRENRRAFTSAVPNPPFFFPPAPGAQLTYDRDYDHIAPKLGLRWETEDRDIQVFANASGSFEPPSFSETVTANTARDAQKATTFEIGTRGLSSFIRWDVAAYHAEIKDELLAIVDPVTLTSTTTNADRTTHTGIEVGTEIDLFGQDWAGEKPDHRVVLRAAWTYGRFKFDRHSVGGVDYAGNTIAGLPPHLIRGELVWENASGYYAGPTFEWVPQKSYIDHRNTFAADPYALLGFKFGRRLETGLSWFVEARNLTDETYAATHGVVDNAAGVDQRQFLPGDGRSAFAGIEYRW
jgi:iron complex outermembrane receptor protein